MPTKKQLVLDLLARAQAFVILDGRAPGVELPHFLRADAKVVLQFAYDLAVPIPDLAVTDEGISGTLSFRREPHFVRVPWSAVYAVTDGESPPAVFADALPIPVGNGNGNGNGNENGNGNGGAGEKEPEPPPPRGRPHLKLVK